jgi:hypothetical protein
MDAGGGPQESRMPLGQGLLLDAALSLRMAASGALREGNEFTARIFDPSSMSERDVVVRVGARETMVVTDSARLENGRWVANVLDTVPVFRVEQQFGGVSISNWIDEDGQIVRAESPLGFTIERMYYELARQAWQGGGSRSAGAGIRRADRGHGHLGERGCHATSPRGRGCGCGWAAWTWRGSTWRAAADAARRHARRDARGTGADVVPSAVSRQRLTWTRSWSRRR